MGRPPCCDKLGMKKGPWTPEEDIILVSYIQEHGPGNWKAIPDDTGLMRCGKSCRLRWTNYLRPGIKRGNFTQQEEKMIIHLQALLGNRWATIASYLPQRTDNDVKNYWNTHLKKKLRKLQGGVGEGQAGNFGSHDGDFSSQYHHHSTDKGQWERWLQTDIHTAKQALQQALSLHKPITSTTTNSNSEFPSKPSNSPFPGVQTRPYASNAENIARLLDSWMTNKPKLHSSNSSISIPAATGGRSGSGSGSGSGSSTSEGEYSRFGSFNSTSPEEQSDDTRSSTQQEDKGTLSFLEKWLFDDAVDGGLQEDQDNLLAHMSLDDTTNLF